MHLGGVGPAVDLVFGADRTVGAPVTVELHHAVRVAQRSALQTGLVGADVRLPAVARVGHVDGPRRERPRERPPAQLRVGHRRVALDVHRRLAHSAGQLVVVRPRVRPCGGNAVWSSTASFRCSRISRIHSKEATRSRDFFSQLPRGLFVYCRHRSKSGAVLY